MSWNSKLTKGLTRRINRTPAGWACLHCMAIGLEHLDICMYQRFQPCALLRRSVRTHKAKYGLGEMIGYPKAIISFD